MNKTRAKWAVVLLLLFIFFIFFIHLVFSGRLILPQTFSAGPLVIHYYGLIMALAVASGFYLAIKRAPAYGLDPKKAEDLIFWLVVGGFIGARLYHVLSSAPYYYQHPSDILKVWNGGLSIYGAVIGGFVVLLLYKKFSTKHFLSAEALAKAGALGALLDWLTPSLILGQIIGRFGNFFNYEAFGYPTSLPWKMFVPINFRPEAYQQFSYFHPFFLYEALGNVLILVIIFSIAKSRTSRPRGENQSLRPAVRDIAAQQSQSENKNFSSGGSLFFSYLLLYNVLRFALEFQRIDSTFIGQFRLNALVSLALAIMSGIYLTYLKLHDKVS